MTSPHVKKIFILFSLLNLLMVLFLIYYGESGFHFDILILRELRIPKIMMAMFAGVFLALSGLLIQLYFQNPLAGPDLMGVSSGASLGQALWMMARPYQFTYSLFFWQVGTMCSSFLGAFIVLLFLIYLSRKETSNLTLIIIGILIASFVSSLISILIARGEALQVKSYLIWSQGTFRNLTQEQLIFVIGFFIVGIFPLFFLRKSMELLSLGEQHALLLGVNIKQLKLMLILFSSVFVASVTMLAGPVGFLGVIAPNLARKILQKNSMGDIILMSCSLGVFFSLLSEVILTIASSFPLTLNAILGLIGAPILILLLKDFKWKN